MAVGFRNGAKSDLTYLRSAADDNEPLAEDLLHSRPGRCRDYERQILDLASESVQGVESGNLKEHPLNLAMAVQHCHPRNDSARATNQGGQFVQDFSIISDFHDQSERSCLASQEFLYHSVS
jgi:hypothetical protein